MKVNAEIIEHREVAEDIFYLELSAPGIAEKAVPGQFIHIRCNDLFDPLLRRPFSLSRFDSNSGILGVVYEVRGKGTRLMSQLLPGKTLDILGPLGNGFDISHLDSNYKAILVGGGIGAAPLVGLAHSLAEKQVQVAVLLGASTRSKLFPPESFAVTGAEVFLATDDGSQGHKGLVTELLPRFFGDSNGRNIVLACGPKGMLKAVAAYCIPNKTPCQLSLEAVMACGVGACQGCVCKVSGEAGEGYARVCKEGPVFEAGEVVWDDRC